MNDTEIANTIDSLTNAIWGLIEFSNLVTKNHQAQREPKPMWNFKDQMRKIIEEIREYSFAVTVKQGDEAEHTRAKQIEEGFDVLFATLTSYTIQNITRDEVHDEVVTIVTKFNERGWLD
ncbi:MAG: hypothetical protein IIC56_08705 [Proteobacteria bacterium]|nr:hypothetical protein [Pseudomonadota bacterium]